MFELVNNVYQSSGSAGLENLVPEIAYLIQTHKNEYPDQEVPVGISFGTGSRTSGLTEYTTPEITPGQTMLQVGDHMVIF